ncbi:hypothetical protein AAHA92_32825 [Salvia divinorum]|uniref:DUF7866 domain-containing protein n=1 Tax=Salvia divinorum TaxID=28513 RepID=A0ABD1FN00_SALDI
MSGIVGGVFLIMALLLSFSCTGFCHEMMVPVVEAETIISRRKLGSFQICALCTCCGGGSRNYCLSTPCCYAINCNIPNRPFGFCSFTPKTCNCFGCHL